MTDKGVNIEASVITRAVAALSRGWNAMRNNDSPMSGNNPNAYFPAGDPLPPVAQEQAVGRQFDYPTFFNVGIRPKSGANDGVSFEQLRALADGYDLLRLVIETRKDQVAALAWTVKYKDEKRKADSTIDNIIKSLKRPDREHDWDQWLRALVEDLLVLDAPVVYPRKTLGGDLYSLDLIDGATIKRVLDDTGRTPLPPYPAYQQILKGMPAVNYTADELIYRPRNYRTNRVYGYSPVEQVIATVNIALRRQLHQLQYYTEGNIPESLISVPSNWTVEQIKTFQAYWDAMLEGNTAQRRHAKFVPGDMKFQPTKDSVLKDEFDEWLARLICFAFSISPQALMAMMNRATAETAKESADGEGLAPLMRWVKSLIDFIIENVFGIADVEFVWDLKQELSPVDQATVHKTYIDAKVLTADEVRADLGRDPLTPEQKEELNPPPPPQLAGPGGEGEPPPGKKADEPPPPDDAAKGDYLGNVVKRRAAAKKAIRPINRDRAVVTKATKEIAGVVEKAFAGCADEVIGALGEVMKADESALFRVLDSLKLSSLVSLIGDIQPIIERIAADGALEALIQIGIDDTGITDLVNERAVEWAKNHAAELVGKKWVDGELVDNPAARWRIDEYTRAGLRKLVELATQGGWGKDKLADEIRGSYLFSVQRAEVVARTEAAISDVQGNMAAYRASGVVVGKRWIVGQDEFCDVCALNVLDDVIGLDGVFSSGDGEPPAHPNCRCDVLPVLDKESQ